MPKTMIMIRPAEGKYKTRSAITKPTVNNKFEAGKNDNTPRKNPIWICLQSKLLYHNNNNFIK